MTDSAQISLIPFSAVLGIEEELNAIRSRRLTLSANLEPGSDVKDSKERTLRKAKWMVTFSEGDCYNEYATAQNAIGIMKYWPQDRSIEDNSPETCWISAALKPGNFATLLEAGISGRLPEKLNFRVSGLAYGWEPDGRGTIWNTGEKDALLVLEVSISIPLAVATVPNLADGSSSDIKGAKLGFFKKNK